MEFDFEHHKEVSTMLREAYDGIEKLTHLLHHESRIEGDRDAEVFDPLSEARVAICEAAVALQNRAQRDALALEGKIRDLYNINNDPQSS